MRRHVWEHSIRKGPQLASQPGLLIGCSFFKRKGHGVVLLLPLPMPDPCSLVEHAPQRARIGLSSFGYGQLTLCSRPNRAEIVSIPDGSIENSTNHAENHARRLPFKMVVDERESHHVSPVPSGLKLLRCLGTDNSKETAIVIHPRTQCIRIHCRKYSEYVRQ